MASTSTGYTRASRSIERRKQMPKRDIRTASSTQKGKRGGGNVVVTYRNSRGARVNATVLGAGTASGLKLRVRSGGDTRIIDNVAAASGNKQTNVYEETY